jgi:predicted nucleotidyltransferase
MGRNQVHELNHDHIAAGIAVALAGLRSELWKRLREELRNWHPKPLYASVFGSAARGDGDESSDIDVLLVHPLFPGEKKPKRMNATLSSLFSDALGDFVASSGDLDPAPQWERNIDQLRERVQAWTGNRLQVVDLSFHDWRYPDESSQLLFSEIQRDGIELVTSRMVSTSVAVGELGV